MSTIPISDEMAEMIGYLKWIGVLKPFDIATSHYDELNEMRENGVSDKEIKQYCAQWDKNFKVDVFIEKLQLFLKENDNRYPSVYVSSHDKRISEDIEQEKKLARQVNAVRQARKCQGTLHLTMEMVEKLDSIGFIWESRRKKHNDELKL